MDALPEYSYVTLIQPFGSLPKGAEGTIIIVYPEARSYMIEFFTPTRSLETVGMEMVKLSANG